MNTIEKTRKPFQENYFAMYSSLWDGIVTDPVLMLIPTDDHIVHRGDGIFETFKCVEGSIYNMRTHLERLKDSADELHFKLPATLEQISQKTVETVKAAGKINCLIRLLVSRGPGSFDVNPYDCPESHLYIIVTRLKKPFMEEHPEGARLKTSCIPVKDSFFANIKNCNYLPNVLMKKEAIDAGVDFVAAFDEKGFLAEGATENIGIMTKQKELLFPEPGRILRGTTMVRIIELAQELVKKGDLIKAGYADISKTDMLNAAEILVVGTTHDVVMVKEFDSIPVVSGATGSICGKIRSLLRKDILYNRQLLTPVFV